MQRYIKYILILAILLIPNISQAYTCGMTTSGGDRAWATAATWFDCGGGVPGSGDDVIATSTSGASTIAANITVKSLDMTGYTNTLTHNAVTLTVAGNVTLASGMTYTLGNALTSALTITATSNLTTNSKIIGNFVYNKTGGTLTMLDSATSTGNFTLTAGTFTPGTNTWTLSGATHTITPTVSLTFYDLKRTGTTAKTDTLTLAGNIIVSNTFTVNGASSTSRVLVTSNTLGTPRTITAANVSISNADFRDITGAGAATWDLSAITGGSGNAGGNSMKALGDAAFTTATTTNWVHQGLATQNWSNSANWNWANGTATSTVGSRVPLPQDDVSFNGGSFVATGKTVTLDMPRAGKSIDWTGATFSPTWTNSTNSTIYGSLTLISGMTFTQANSLIFEGRAAGMPVGGWTLTSAGKSFANTTTMQMFGGTLTLQDAFVHTSSGLFSINNGTFNANIFNVTALNVIYGSVSNTRGVIMGSGTWTANGTGVNTWNAGTVTGLTFDKGTATIILSNTTATAKTFAGGGLTYNNVTFSGDNITVTGANTFNTMAVNNAGDTNTNGLILTTGTATTTITNLTTNATTTSDRAILKSSTAGTIAGLRANTGANICVDYMSIKDIRAYGTSVWYAGANSLDVSGNIGWSFTACPSGAEAGGKPNYYQKGNSFINSNSFIK